MFYIYAVISNITNNLVKWIGGEGGIRTHDTVSRIHAFQACALSHSATSPERKNRGGQYSGRGPGYNPRSRFPPHARSGGGCGGTISCAFRYSGRPERGEAGGCHGSWAIVMAPRHSDSDHHFDMGAWRPTWLILPSGSIVVSAYEGPTSSR